MNDNYQKIQLAGEEEDVARIVGTLSAIKSGKLSDDLKLINYFHEVPVSYPAAILSVEQDAVELLVHQHQAVVISLDKLTVLKSSHFPRDVVARVAYVNVEKSVIVLTNFSFAVVRAERRMSVRVQVEEKIAARFRGAAAEIAGNLHDISLTGLSVNLAADPGLPLSAEGEVTVALPTGAVTVSASLLKSHDTENGWRCIFEIKPGRAEEGIMGRYIMQRQVEIIRELKDHPGLLKAAPARKHAV